jgi:ring-1,2-phenylacetyl-CoA epoxidase subunit PaaC
MTGALNELWQFTEELYTPVAYEGAFNENVRESWKQRVADIFRQAHLSPPANTTMIFGGKEGRHGEYLNEVLNEMQYMQRTYPGMEW